MNRLLHIAIVLTILLPVTEARSTEVAELVRFVPHSANAVGVIRASEILQTPLARREHWDERREQFLSGAQQVPPWADVVVLASLVHPTVPEETWTVALLPMGDGVDLKSIAWHEDSTVQDIAGFPSVRSRRGAYLVEVDSNVLAVRSPGIRQETARWLRVLADDGPMASEYLSQAAATAPHILLALDMTDALDPVAMHQRLDEIPELKDQHDRHDKLLKQLVNLRGIRFAATIDEAINGRVIIDFSNPPTDTQHLRTLFLTMLSDLQAELEELARAEMSVEGNSLVFSTELTGSGLRRVMSLLMSPTPEPPPREVIVDRTTRGRIAPNEDQTARYFASVTDIIDDLQRLNRKAKDYLRTATWHDNFARRIDQLSIVGVEPDVVAFGTQTASRLRALAASLRGVAVEVDTQRRSITYDFKVKPGWAAFNVWGGYGYQPNTLQVSSNLREVRERIAQAVAAGAREREQIWALITDEHQTMKHWLLDRYGPDFGKRRRTRSSTSPPDN